MQKNTMLQGVGKKNGSLKLIAALIIAAGSIGSASATERSGKEVVDTVLHRLPRQRQRWRAPKIGDQAEWAVHRKASPT